ncbi:MAG TPA: hypothetical protein VMF31_06190 [Solirubrobacterales bacterium]|nr:hypothetical protein [Solirubrobacterales bacterium]
MNRAASLKLALIGATGPVSAGPVSADAGDGGPLTEIGSASGRGADLVLLPQLSFSPYFPARRDREALELGERLPSKQMRTALDAAGDCLIAASVYECVGEGVFYVRGELGSRAEGCLLAERQHRPEAGRGRYEQMFFSPGHGPRSVAGLPWGATGLLVGADLREIDAWSELSRLGARLVLGSVSEDRDGWARTTRIAAGLAAVNGIALALVNRAPSEGEPGFAGGGLVVDGVGREIAPDADGLFNLEISDCVEGES